ncbi:MAG: VOC family protein [Acidimicrobiales bacterium]
MYDAITHHGIYVLDQDEALDFYVTKLGLEVRSDMDLGFMRWLTVGVPGDTSREVLLEVPAPPAVSEDAAEQIRDLLTKGAMGLALILRTDDCYRTYDELRSRGVEFVQEPTEQPYGVDCEVRDPFGNHIRIGTQADVMGDFDGAAERWQSEAGTASGT